MLDDSFQPSDAVGDLGSAGTEGEPAVGGSAGTTGGVGGAAGGGMSGSAGVGNGGSGSASVAGSGGAAGSAQSAEVQVLASAPEDGATGVPSDSALVLNFSAPMDTDSVLAAYSSTELPASQVNFTWSDADAVLHIQPTAPLQIAAGSDPALVVPASYTVRLSAQARDKQGHALVAKQVSFSVLRSITQTLSAVQNRDLTGNWRSDSSYGLAYCERIDTTICMGDSPATNYPAYKAFATFDLRALPATLGAFTAAELSSTVATAYGTPFVDLGSLQIEHVSFTSIGDAAYAAAALSARQLMSNGATSGDRLSANVLGDVQADWSVRDYSQYRMAFDVGTDSDAVADLLVCDWSTALLSVTYTLP